MAASSPRWTGRGGLRVWEATTGKQLLPPLGGAPLRVSDYGFLTGGRNLVTLEADGAASVWELPTGRRLRMFRISTASSAVFDPGYRTVAVVAKDQQALLWDVTSGRK